MIARNKVAARACLLMHGLLMGQELGNCKAYLMKVAEWEQRYARDWCRVECQSQHIQLL